MQPVTPMEFTREPSNELAEVSTGSEDNPPSLTASQQGMCSLDGRCVIERHGDHRFRWSERMWSPPPESNRRPHPYHRCAGGSRRHAAPHVPAQPRRSEGLWRVASWGGMRLRVAQFLAYLWHAIHATGAAQTSRPFSMNRSASPERSVAGAARGDPQRRGSSGVAGVGSDRSRCRPGRSVLWLSRRSVRLDGSLRRWAPSPLPRPSRQRVDSAVRVRAGGRLLPPPPACGPAGRPAAGGPARRSGRPTG
jgi:hypothetical protein